MPSIKKLVLVLYLLVYGLSSPPLSAAEFSAHIKNITISQQHAWYVLNAQVEYGLSPIAKKAIQNSIPLCWHLKIRLRENGLLYDQTVAKLNYRYRIRYHALLNTYSVKNENTGEIKKFSSLLEALDSLSRLHNIPLIPVDDIDAHQHYQVALKLAFEKEQLPLPLRPVAYLNAEWDLSSDWYLWPLQN